MATFLYMIGFVANLMVPKSVDSGKQEPTSRALLINVLLVALFALQHSGMARAGFKKWWTKVVPPPAERSAYVLNASLLLALLFWQWRPIPAVVWNVQSPAWWLVLQVLFCCGWLIVLVSSFLIDHFELTGLRQVQAYLAGNEYSAPEFKTPWLYRCVRHPLYMGLLIAIWSAPTMTLGHVEFAMAITAYIFLGILFEERDLVRSHGDAYRRYRQEVPMILPIPRKK